MSPASIWSSASRYATRAPEGAAGALSAASRASARSCSGEVYGGSVGGSPAAGGGPWRRSTISSARIFTSGSAEPVSACARWSASRREPAASRPSATIIRSASAAARSSTSSHGRRSAGSLQCCSPATSGANPVVGSAFDRVLPALLVRLFDSHTRASSTARSAGGRSVAARTALAEDALVVEKNSRSTPFLASAVRNASAEVSRAGVVPRYGRSTSVRNVSFWPSRFQPRLTSASGCTTDAGPAVPRICTADGGAIDIVSWMASRGGSQAPSAGASSGGTVPRRPNGSGDNRPCCDAETVILSCLLGFSTPVASTRSPTSSGRERVTRRFIASVRPASSSGASRSRRYSWAAPDAVITATTDAEPSGAKSSVELTATAPSVTPSSGSRTGSSPGSHTVAPRSDAGRSGTATRSEPGSR